MTGIRNLFDLVCTSLVSGVARKAKSSYAQLCMPQLPLICLLLFFFYFFGALKYIRNDQRGKKIHFTV